MRYKRPAILTIACWLHVLLLFWAAYAFSATLLFERESPLRLLLCGLLPIIPIMLGWVLAPKIRNFFLYSLVGVLLCIVMGILASVVAGPEWTQVMAGVVLTVFFTFLVFFLYAKSKRDYGRLKQEYQATHEDSDFVIQEREMDNFLKNPQAAHLWWFAGLYVFAIIMDKRGCLIYLFAMTLADIVVLSAYLYGSSFYEYMREKKGAANLPLATMRRIHRFFGICGGLLLAMFLLPSILFGKEISVDFSLEQPVIDVEDSWASADGSNYGGGFSTDAISQLDTMETRTLPDWIQSLMQLIAYAIMAVAVVLIIVAIVVMIRRFKKDFAVEEEDEVVNLDEEAPVGVQRVLRRRTHESFLSPSQQIRRRYKRVIRKAAKAAPSRWGTPTEIEHQAAVAQDGQMQTLHGYYEKARYSEGGCTQEDLKNLRETL